MISEIHVRNISLIPELHLSLGGGLAILTGETGAGKSILLGALSLLLGERASADLIRTGCESASVEALFTLDHAPRVAGLLAAHGLPEADDALVIKREITRSGRNKCFVNGGLTTLAVLAELGSELVDLHGQHEHQSLLHRSRQRDLLDAWAGLLPARAEVAGLHQRWQQCRQARERLAMDEAERVRRLDMLSYQIDEIDAAKLLPGELESLQEEKGRLAHAERLSEAMQGVLDILHRAEGVAVRDGLAKSASALTDAARFDTRLGELADALRTAEIQVGDVVERLSSLADGFEADPARLEAVEERLDLLHKLQRKYGDGAEAILAFREKIAAERNSLTHQDEELEKLAKAEQAVAADLLEKAQALSVARAAAGQKLAQHMEAQLRELGFLRAEFKVRVTLSERGDGGLAAGGASYHCTAAGIDEVEFFFGPNPGEEPKPVSKTASGGELSRIMLGMKVVAASTAGVPTMIFDEIDTGIGGATADAVGRKLAEVAKSRQVIVITHLPQIARFARQHFLVEKRVEFGRTSTAVDALNPETRVTELARLLSGEPVTPTALQHARELLERPAAQP